MIYTDTPFHNVLERFVPIVGASWIHGKYEGINCGYERLIPISDFTHGEHSANGEVGYFFYRDDEMYKWSEQHCYLLDDSSEGMFSISSFQLPNFRCNAFLKNIIHDPQDGIPYEDHDALLQIGMINVISVLTPDNPEDNIFSRWVLDSVYASCVSNVV